MSKRKIREGYVWRRGKKIPIVTITDDTPAKAKWQGEFYAQVLLKEAAEVAKATKSQQLFIWIWLLHQAWRKGSKTFSVSNTALTEYGVNRWAKYRALLALESAGFIAIKRNANQALTVTILKGTIKK